MWEERIDREHLVGPIGKKSDELAAIHEVLSPELQDLRDPYSRFTGGKHRPHVRHHESRGGIDSDHLLTSSKHASLHHLARCESAARWLSEAHGKIESVGHEVPHMVTHDQLEPQGSGRFMNVASWSAKTMREKNGSTRHSGRSRSGHSPPRAGYRGTSAAAVDGMSLRAARSDRHLAWLRVDCRETRLQERSRRTPPSRCSLGRGQRPRAHHGHGCLAQVRSIYNHKEFRPGAGPDRAAAALLAVHSAERGEGRAIIILPIFCERKGIPSRCSRRSRWCGRACPIPITSPIRAAKP
jgi:hypothetical protein